MNTIRAAMLLIAITQLLPSLQAQQISLDPSIDDCGEDCYAIYADPVGNFQGQITHLWNSGETADAITICFPGCYSVTITDEVGTTADTTFCLDVVFDAAADILSTPACPSTETVVIDSLLTEECEQVCLGTTVNYSISSAPDSAAWNVYNLNGGGAPDYEQLPDGSIEVSYNQPGQYGINLFGNVNEPPFFCDVDAFSCVTVVVPPAADFSSTPAVEDNGITLCKEQPLFLEYTGEEADSLLWDFGNGITANEGNLDYAYNEAGTYELTLIAYRACACNDTTTVAVEVLDTETPIVDCVGTVCEGMMGTYTAQTSCGAYLWEVSDNGVVVDGGGPQDDFVSVLWEEGPEGTVVLTTEDCPGLSCQIPATLQVPIISDNATVDGPVEVCPGQEAIYSLPPYEGVQFDWTAGPNGSIVSGQGTHEIVVEWANAPNAGPQEVRVDFENCYLGCGGSAVLEVAIRPEFYIEGLIEVCQGDSYPFQAIALGTGAPVEALWSLENAEGEEVWSGSAAAGLAVIDFSLPAGSYQVVALPAEDNSSCLERQTRRVRVLAPPPPVDGIIGNTVICPNSTAAYRLQSATEHVRFEWVVTNGSQTYVEEGRSINVTWGNSPPYELSVVQINTRGIACVSEAVTLEIEAFSGLELSGDEDGCLDGISVFSATQAEYLEYEWQITPASAGTIISEADESTVSILWHQAGPASVTVSVCDESATAGLEVRIPPQPVVNHPAFFCPDEEASVSATAGFEAYRWYNEAGLLVAQGQNPDIAPGSYRLEVDDEFGCSGSAIFRIKPYPRSEVSISTPDRWVWCQAPVSTRLIAQASEAGFSYQWLRDGQPVGADEPTYQATAFGVYQVEITDQYGCTYLSNTFEVEQNCGGDSPGGPINGGGGVGCGNFTIDNVISTDMECERKNYMDLSEGNLPEETSWAFFFRDGVLTQTATGADVTVEHDEVGYYRTRMITRFENPAEPSSIISCFQIRVDSIEALADFTVESGCAGEPVSFSDVSTHLPGLSITSWAWDFGDPTSGSNTSAAQNPTHTYAAPGSYNVRLEITMSTGCISVIEKEVTVYGPPEVVFDPPESSCAQSATAFVAPPNNGKSYQWNFGNPGSGDANQSARQLAYHRYELPGDYQVSLTGTNIYGCSDTYTQEISIAPNPLSGEITLDPDPPVCEGTTVAATASPGGNSWAWSEGSVSETALLTDEGVYEVTVTDLNGCTYEPPGVAIDILPAPSTDVRVVEYDAYEQPIAYYYESYETCFGEDVFLEALEQSGQSYTWSDNQLGAAAEFSEEKNNLLEVGTQTVSVEVTDLETGCTAVYEFTLTVHGLPEVPLVQSDQMDPVCGGNPVTLSVSNPQAGITYIWSNDEAGSSITVNEAGLYTVTAINTNGCAMESEPFEILPGPDIARIPNGCYTRCAPDTLCLPELPGVFSYQWFFNGSPIAAPEGTIPELVIEEEGTYFVEMMNINGCVLQSDPLSITFIEGQGDIVGGVYFDVNQNGQIDAADTLMQGVGVELLQNGNSLGSVLTNEDGGYGFFGQDSEQDYQLELDTTMLPTHVEAYWTSVDTTLRGCGQSTTVNWLVWLNCPSTSSDTLSLEACEGTTITYNGTEVPAGTEQSFTFLNFEGCDSTVTVRVAALQTYETELAYTFCDGEALVHDGIPLQAGTNEIVLPAANGCDSILLIEVTQLPPINEQIEVLLCSGETYEFNGQALSPGEQLSLTLTSSQGCDSTVTVSVSESPPAEARLSLDGDCPQGSTGAVQVALQDAGQPPYQYSLDDINYQSEPVFQGLAGGSYTLFWTDGNGCKQSLDFGIPDVPPLEVALEYDTLSCELPRVNVSVRVTSGETDELDYNWSDGYGGLSRYIDQPGTYTLQVDNGCETYEATVFQPVPNVAEDALLYVPNAFSPNEDGNNDTFRAFAGSRVEALSGYRLQVFDRWGNQIFESEQPTEGWTGHFREEPLNKGLYVWQLEAVVRACDQEMELREHGEVMLMR